MICVFDPVRVDAFARLLASPQPKDLPRGSHVYRWDGDPDRRTTRLPGILMGWLQRRHLDTDVEEPIATATRTFRHRPVCPVRRSNPGLRVLHPTGTASGARSSTHAIAEAR